MPKFWLLLSNNDVMPCVAKDMASTPIKIGKLDVIAVGNGREVMDALKDVVRSVCLGHQ